MVGSGPDSDHILVPAGLSSGLNPLGGSAFPEVWRERGRTCTLLRSTVMGPRCPEDAPESLDGDGAVVMAWSPFLSCAPCSSPCRVGSGGQQASVAFNRDSDYVPGSSARSTRHPGGPHLGGASVPMKVQNLVMVSVIFGLSLCWLARPIKIY